MIESNREPFGSTPYPPAAIARSAGAFATCMVVSVLAAACSSSEDENNSDAFVVRSTGHAAATGSTPLLGDGDWLAYLLSEAAQGAAGTDFNGDMDTLDSIATRVNTASGAREVLDIAAQSLAFARRTLFLVVEESEDNDNWNGDSDMADRVLLYITPSMQEPLFLDELAPGEGVTAIGGSVVYASATTPTVGMTSNLRITTVASSGTAPSAPTTVLMNDMDPDPGGDGVSYRIIGHDGDIVFALADETAEGMLNGDMDSSDTAIFAVLDAGATTPEITSTELAFATGSTPTAVPISGGGEWLVAFLVEEAAESMNLNDPGRFSMAWQPDVCRLAMVGDTDQDDFVLHWFQLTDLTMNTAAVNTGLVGDANGTAYALRSRFVGVVSPESEEGSGGGCFLNDDGDADDDIFRWVDASNPAAQPLPVTAPSRLLAVDTSVPGGSGGVVRMSDLWVLHVDEAADGRSYDGEPGTDRVLIGAHKPTSSGQAWNFNHGSGSPMRPVGVSWMAEDPESASRFFAAFLEEVNSLAGPGAGDLNGDGDIADAVPTVPTIVSSNILTFPGVATAASRTNAGLTVEENVGYYRVSEADQGNTDLNLDGDTNDVIIQRFSLLNSFPRTLMATSNNIPVDSVSFGGGDATFGAFVTEEFQSGNDLNNDGDLGDFVVRYFRLP